MGAAVRLIEDDSLQAKEDGYQVSVRLNWYRSLPLSCVEKVRLALDGVWAEPSAIRLGINDHEYRLEELAERIEEFWFVQDSAILNVRQPGAVTPGETHTIEVEYALRFPYIPIGPGKFLVNINKYTSTQVAV